MSSNLILVRESKSILGVALSVSLLVGGCSTIKGWMGSDKDEPSAAEMAELCDMQRKMTNMPRDSQQALLESHMKSAHGSTDAQALARHRELMQQKCRAS
jgi:hypothetical protein